MHSTDPGASAASGLLKEIPVQGSFPGIPNLSRIRGSSSPIR